MCYIPVSVDTGINRSHNTLKWKHQAKSVLITLCLSCYSTRKSVL